MLLQVHDELVFEVAPGEQDALDALVREQMGSAADLLVPLDVSVGTGAAGTSGTWPRCTRGAPERSEGRAEQ